MNALKSIIIPGYTTQNRKLEVSMTHREKFKFILFLVLFTFILGLGSPAPQFLTISEKFINPIIPLGWNVNYISMTHGAKGMSEDIFFTLGLSAPQF